MLRDLILFEARCILNRGPTNDALTAVDLQVSMFTFYQLAKSACFEHADLTPLFNRKEISMKCPVCPDVTLLMMDRQTVEIDFCPNCRGIWLDRGELDKLLALAAPTFHAASREADVPNSGRYNGDRRSSDHYVETRNEKSNDRRKKSWLNEIFD